MVKLLDGVERKLCPSAPFKTKMVLGGFRKRLREGSAARRPKRVEKKLEAFVLVPIAPKWQQENREEVAA